MYSQTELGEGKDIFNEYSYISDSVTVKMNLNKICEYTFHE